MSATSGLIGIREAPDDDDDDDEEDGNEDKGEAVEDDTAGCKGAAVFVVFCFFPCSCLRGKSLEGTTGVDWVTLRLLLSLWVWVLVSVDEGFEGILAGEGNLIVVVFFCWTTSKLVVEGEEEDVDVVEEEARITDEGIITVDFWVLIGRDEVEFCFCFDIAIVEDFVVLGVNASSMDDKEVDAG